MRRNRPPGWRPNSSQIIRSATLWTAGILALGTAIATAIAVGNGNDAVTRGILLAGILLIVSTLVSWAVMALLYRRFGGGGAGIVLGYIIKLAGLMAVLGLVDSFDRVAFVVAFVVGVIVTLVVESVVIMSGPGPAIGDEG